jgi:thiol-disulfide isomerase/thioredoxin
MTPYFRTLVATLLLLPAMVYAAGIEFSSTDLNGKVHRLSDYKGKWVIVNYWATWCPPCLDEIPELVEFHDKHSERDAVVLGVNYESIDDDYLKTFIEEFFVSYPILRADLNRAPPFGRLYGLPTTFVVSPDGKLVETRTGSVDMKWLEAVVKSNDSVGFTKQ